MRIKSNTIMPKHSQVDKFDTESDPMDLPKSTSSISIVQPLLKKMKEKKQTTVTIPVIKENNNNINKNYRFVSFCFIFLFYNMFLIIDK